MLFANYRNSSSDEKVQLPLEMGAKRMTLPIWTVQLPHGPGSHLTPYIPKLINTSPSPTNMPEPEAAAERERNVMEGEERTEQVFACLCSSTGGGG